jgi:phospholipid/cholesterol/gamma-HCH transport system substrate-binding protein
VSSIAPLDVQSGEAPPAAPSGAPPAVPGDAPPAAPSGAPPVAPSDVPPAIPSGDAPAAGGAAPAAPSAFGHSGSQPGAQPGPSVAIAQYDPRTGSYFTPDGQVYRQSDLATRKGPKTWKDMFAT